MESLRLPVVPQQTTPVAWLILIFSLSFFYLLTATLRPVDPYDEGVILTGAWLTSLGKLPHLDFWTVYSPGQFLAVGALFKLFAVEVFTLRLYDCVVRALISVLVFQLTTRLSNRACGIGAAILACLWLERFGRFGYNVFPALACILLAQLVLTRPSSRNAHGYLAGALIFGCGFFRQDFVVYALLASLPLIVGQHAPYPRLRKELLITLILLGALSTIVISFFIPLSRLFENLIVFPLTQFAGSVSTRPNARLHHELTTSILFSFPLVISFLVGLFWRRHSSVISKGNAPAQTRRLLLSLVVVTVALLNHARVRQDFAHLFPSFIPAICLLGSSLFIHVGRRSRKHIAALTVICIFLVLLVGEPLNSKIDELKSSSLRSPILASRKAQLEFQSVTRRIEQQCPGKRLYVAKPPSSKSERSDVYLYFATRNIPATYYYEPHLGITDREDIQKRILSDLGESQPECIVLADPFSVSLKEVDPELASAAAGTVLTNYIESFYKIGWAGEHYVLLLAIKPTRE